MQLTVRRNAGSTPPGSPGFFLPALRDWFIQTIGQATAIQAAAWPVIADGASALIMAPTGTGKTLAAWLPIIDRVGRQRTRKRGVHALYISPLRALSRDVANNLAAPLAALENQPDAPRLGLRTGDTPPAERARQRRYPPELLVTTPESLYVLLGSDGGRSMLRTVETVLVDEIHALVDNKRGIHLALSLERLDHLRGRSIQRIGISATAHPAARIAAFLAGSGRDCRILAAPAAQQPEIRIDLPIRPLGYFTTCEYWKQVHDRLAELAATHSSILVFCNTRAQVERTAQALSWRLGTEENGSCMVAAHHGSLGFDARAEVEFGLKSGNLRVVVSSASLELGIDIGAVDLVCQIGSPGRINVLRQRAGRACHRPDATPRACLFPLTLTDLLEARALVNAVGEAEFDMTEIQPAAADVLCQHLVAMSSGGIPDPDTLFSIVRGADPWKDMARAAFDGVLNMLSSGFIPGREHGRTLVRLDDHGAGLVAQDGARESALLNAGTIPEWFEYDVVCQPGLETVGRLDEDFAFESSPGQVFQLGNRVFRIVRITPGKVWVEDARNETPNLPFWFGEGPARSPALSGHVLRILSEYESGRQCKPIRAGIAETAAAQLDRFLQESLAAFGCLPGPERIVVERFPDPGGDRHLVIHSFHGSRINRAWGLALRKRFCRRFNFELQAAATDNAVLLSLGVTNEFALSEVSGYLSTESVRDILIQAVLDTPLYLTRFRWCANNALAIARRDRRGPVAAQIQRNQTENLLAMVFPDQLACLENLNGDRQVPDHPLVKQALEDCLENYLDTSGLEELLAGIHRGNIEVHCVEGLQPSPLARAAMHAPRHSYLDPAAAEERRTRAFESASMIGATGIIMPADFDRTTAAQARRAWIRVRGRNGFERDLLRAGYMLRSEGETGISTTGAGAAGGWVEVFRGMVRDRAAVCFQPDTSRSFWASYDRLPELLSVWPDGVVTPKIPGALMPHARADPQAALASLLHGRLRALGCVDAALLADETGLPVRRVDSALESIPGCRYSDGKWRLD